MQKGGRYWPPFCTTDRTGKCSMADREQREIQEARLFEIYLMQNLMAGDNPVVTTKYLRTREEYAMSGMSATEIDAVKARAQRAYKAMK